MDSFNYFLKIESKKPKFIKNIEIFDQFPNTNHLEIVSLLSKVK